MIYAISRNLRDLCGEGNIETPFANLVIGPYEGGDRKKNLDLIFVNQIDKFHHSVDESTGSDKFRRSFSYSM